MSYTAIKVQSLSKRYKIGGKPVNYKTLGESIRRGFQYNIFELLRKSREEDYFWTLKDISFEVKAGDVMGVIGHNGAGKSTLLKILSRITEPTTGAADIYGRVGSLLEVGTGFHSELSGRENIYLSGAILGMRNNDIKCRFDEIVAFAEVEKFIDTPIKHYSTGMYLRLAFAVAAHLETEILLVDEVLAVGDLVFQKKCLNKMENVAQEGRTILFVSHNLGVIKELCKTALILKDGKVDYLGSVVSGIQHYARGIVNKRYATAGNHQTDGWSQTLINEQREENNCINNTDFFEITSTLCLPHDSEKAVLHCFMEDAESYQVVHNYISTRDIGRNTLKAGIYQIKTQMPPLWLKPGVYTLYLKLIAETQDAMEVKYLSERVVVDVTDKTGIFAGKVYATILPPMKWDVSSFIKADNVKKHTL